VEVTGDLSELLAHQAGVLSRRQAIARGLRDSDIRRMLRRRQWAAVHPGVYVDHTGPLTWEQRAWAAVLFAWPAALAGESALAVGGGFERVSSDHAVIHVAIDHRRAVRAPHGVRIHRRRRLEGLVRWNLSPPRLRLEEAVLDVALGTADDLEAIGVLARAVQTRRTTAGRLIASLDERPRVRRRAWLRDVLRDLAEGACSVLEREHMVRVERAHGLPRGLRQHRQATRTRVVYRDVDHGSVIIELDGRLFHERADRRDRDFERDLDAAVDGRDTVRLSWGQVHSRPCSTAAKVATILQRHGWRGTPRPCGPGCAVGSGGLAATG
jgi:hypothetical protein